MKALLMGDALRINSRHLGAKIALRDAQRAFTYAELNARSNRLAHWLHHLGLRRGDLLTVVLGNRIEYAEVVYAAAKIGVVTVPMDVRWGPVELESMAKFFGTAAAIVDTDLLAAGGALEARQVWSPERTVVVGQLPNGADTYEERLGQFPDHEPSVEVAEDDIFMLMLTSGTTGVPKACVATHRTFALRCVNYAVGDAALKSEDVYLSSLPLYFNAGRGSLVGHLFHGATVVLLNRFDPHLVLSSVERYGATSLYFVPTMCERVLTTLREQPYQVETVRLIRTTGSALHESTRLGFREFFHCEIYDSYGSTDCGSITRPSRGEHSSPPGSAGRPGWQTEVGIFDDAGCEVPHGSQGEICVRGPLVCDGYYANPEANANSFRGGWFLTGDIGYLDAEGFLFVTGRKKNMIKSGGISIYPEEIEEVLKRHSEVLEAVVVGVPDERWEEAVHAVVVTGRDSQLQADDLIAYCKQHMAAYKSPKNISLLTDLAALPMTSVGKLDRTRLRQQLVERANSGAAL